MRAVAAILFFAVLASVARADDSEEPRPRFTSQGVLVTDQTKEIEGVEAAYLAETIKQAQTMTGWAERYRSSPLVSVNAIASTLERLAEYKVEPTESEVEAMRAALVQSLSDKDDLVRVRGLRGLAVIGEEADAAPVARLIASDPIKENRLHGIALAGKIKGKAAIPTLKQLVTAKEQPADERLAAVAALVAIDSKPARAALVAAAKSVKKEKQLADSIAAALAKRGAFEQK